MLFSIIIPTFNRANLIGRAVSSVISQTCADWELIVVDDGSTDNTKAIVLQYEHDKIVYIYQNNAERSAARNNGIANARGQYICFLDSDDYYLPDYLSTLCKFIENKGFPVALIQSGFVYVDDEGTEIHRVMPFDESNSLVLDLFRRERTINSQCICVHKSLLEKHKFDVRFSLWEDTHLWIRVLCNCKYLPLFVNKVAIVQHEQSTVSRGMNVVKLNDVKRYLAAIDDLFTNHLGDLARAGVSIKYCRNYKDAKINMYLYQARENKQFSVSVPICRLLLINRFSLKNIATVVKVFVCWFIYILT